MATIALETGKIDVLKELRHFIIDFVYSTNDIEKLKQFVGIIDNKPQSLIDILKSESKRTGKKISEIVSPSGDEWFDNEDNLKLLEQGIKEAEKGETVEIDVNELLSEVNG